MKCLTCKNNGTNKCPIYHGNIIISDDCPDYVDGGKIGFIDAGSVYISKPVFCSDCIICGEPVELSEFEAQIQFVVKVCDKCKQAIMKVREELE